MNDRQIAGNLDRIAEYVDRIERYFAGIESPEGFLASVDGNKTLDAIGMMLVSVGEAVKRIDKVTEGKFLEKFPEIDWRGVMRTRDILTHHYEKLDHEIVFHVRSHHIQPLRRAIERMRKETSDTGESSA